jgi:ribosomal protein S18 acetylase RimI-like enzyme
MVEVRAATAEDWRLLRDVRLAALRDAPGAFLSTHEERATPTEEYWRGRINSGGTFFAYLPEVNGSYPAGLVGGFQGKPGTVELVSLWVRPKARGRGVGEALVDAVVNWARARETISVHLWLMETNEHARLLYERCGFSSTGERQPLPSNEELTEIGMTRLL